MPKYKIDLNQRTALHVAVMHEHRTEIVKILLNHGVRDLCKKKSAGIRKKCLVNKARTVMYINVMNLFFAFFIFPLYKKWKVIFSFFQGRKKRKFPKMKMPY